MGISIITAFDFNRVIGYENELPWYLPEDLKHFKKLTDGKTVVMGRKTHESLVKKFGEVVLPNRKCVVLSDSLTPSVCAAHYRSANLVFTRSIDKVIDLTKGGEDVFVIGGASVYEQFIPLADTFYLTEVHRNSGMGDTYFPEIDWSDWEERSRETVLRDELNEYTMTFFKYERKF